MPKTSFTKLKTKTQVSSKHVQIPDTDVTLEILTYLPQDLKAQLIGFVVERSIDQTTGCSSPLRLDTWFSIALAKYYGQITFTDKQLDDPGKVYDTLQLNGVFNIIADSVPEDEYNYIKTCVEQTAQDVARYNTSAAGIVGAMRQESGGLSGQLDEMLNKIKDREGINELVAIRDTIVGQSAPEKKRGNIS